LPSFQNEPLLLNINVDLSTKRINDPTVGNPLKLYGDASVGETVIAEWDADNDLFKDLEYNHSLELMKFLCLKMTKPLCISINQRFNKASKITHL
jgi:hypothetical protein